MDVGRAGVAIATIAVAVGCAACTRGATDEATLPALEVLSDRYVVTNEDGTWTIRTGCRTRGTTTVGPGYVSRLVTRDGTVIVDDHRRAGPLNDPEFGGLGAFAWHHARGRPRRLRFTGANAWELSGRSCAGTNKGFGVVGTRLSERPRLDGDSVRFTIDVLFSDRFTFPRPLLRVRYRYAISPSLVESWVDVTSLCGGGRCGRTRATAFVKEPKLVAHVTGGGFTRMATYGESGRLRCIYVGGGAPTGPVLDTGQCGADDRMRLRFDFGSPDSDEDGDCAARACLDVVMRAAANDGATERWEGASSGLDAWAVAADSRPAAFGRDTASVDGVVWDCNGGSPAGRDVRRWETTGRRNARGRYLSLGGIFPAWEGGRGGYDCEPLARAFGPDGETFGAYAAYSLTT